MPALTRHTPLLFQNTPPSPLDLTPPPQQNHIFPKSHQCPGVNFVEGYDGWGEVVIEGGETYQAGTKELCYLGRAADSTPVDIAEEFDCDAYSASAPMTNEHPYLVSFINLCCCGVNHTSCLSDANASPAWTTCVCARGVRVWLFVVVCPFIFIVLPRFRSFFLFRTPSRRLEYTKNHNAAGPPSQKLPPRRFVFSLWCCLLYRGPPSRVICLCFLPSGLPSEGAGHGGGQVVGLWERGLLLRHTAGEKGWPGGGWKEI